MGDKMASGPFSTHCIIIYPKQLLWCLSTLMQSVNTDMHRCILCETVNHFILIVTIVLVDILGMQLLKFLNVFQLFYSLLQ